MHDIDLILLDRSVPTNSVLSGELQYPPSDWLRTGYAPVTFPDGSTGWERLNAYQVCAAYGRTANPDEIAAFYAGSAAQELFKRLALTFGQFFPLNAGQWEADLCGTPNPITHLYLWQTTADVFTYYMTGKRSQQRKVLSPQARQEYLNTLWLYLHHGQTAAACQERHLRALKPERIKNVAGELERYFARRTPSRCHAGSQAALHPGDSGRTAHADPDWTW